MSNIPPKKQVALALLEQSGIFIHLDPRGKDVIVPNQFKEQTELVLQFGLNMRVPIKDLEVQDDAICGTLSFSRRPFWCRIPWDAVHAIVSDADRRGFSWQRIAPAAPKRPHLRAVGSEPEPEADASPAAPDAAALSGEGTCKLCSIKWLEEASACPLCGSTREEAFVPAPRSSEVALTSDAPSAPEEAPKPRPARGLTPVAPLARVTESEREMTAAPAAEAGSDAAASTDTTSRDDEAPPDDPPPPPKRPHLRLVK